MVHPSRHATPISGLRFLVVTDWMLVHIWLKNISATHVLHLPAQTRDQWSRDLVVQRFVLRGCLTVICRIRANLRCIAKRLWNLMHLGRDQKLFPHLGEAGTAVFAVEEVE
jgi:hypothetical protein